MIANYEFLGSHDEITAWDCSSRSEVTPGGYEKTKDKRSVGRDMRKHVLSNRAVDARNNPSREQV